MIKKAARLLDGTIVALEDIEDGDLIQFPITPINVKDLKTFRKNMRSN